MTSTTFTPKDIIALRKQYKLGDLFVVDPTGKEVKTEKGSAIYFKFECKNAAGGKQKLRVAGGKQIIASSANIPKDTNRQPVKNPKYLSICFKKLTKEDLDLTEYADAVKDRVIAANHEFCDALQIISDEYNHHANIIAKKKKSKCVFPFVQTHRPATKDEIEQDSKRADEEKLFKDGEFVLLPTPLYRLKLTADANGVIGNTQYESKDVKHTTPSVFDLRESAKTKDHKQVPAKVIENGKPTNLTVSNAKHFITCFSMTIPIIDFDNFCHSSMGLSFLNHFRELHVIPHRKLKTQFVSDDDVEGIDEYGLLGYKDEDTSNVDEPPAETQSEPKSTKTTKQMKPVDISNLNYGEETTLDEPTATTDDNNVDADNNTADAVDATQIEAIPEPEQVKPAEPAKKPTPMRPTKIAAPRMPTVKKA